MTPAPVKRAFLPVKEREGKHSVSRKAGREEGGFGKLGESSVFLFQSPSLSLSLCPVMFTIEAETLSQRFSDFCVVFNVCDCRSAPALV